MKHKITQLAQELHEASLFNRPIEQLSLSYPLSLEASYAVQAQGLDLRMNRGEKLTGIKLGFTSKAKMEQMGVKEIIWGRLTNKMPIASGSDLKLKDFVRPKAEPEIAFLLKEGMAGYTEESNVLDFVSGITVAMEIADSRYKNFKFSLTDVIADNCFARAYVLGDWKQPSFDISDLAIKMYRNGELVQSGNSKAILGHPLQALKEAIGLTRRYQFELKKGMVVLAGAATPSIGLDLGDQIMVEAEKIGSIQLNVVS